ncbi:MAG: CNNM domain-containing protein [Planctomycetota bacterium]|nr:CNNM domain-containing protein [Planctomycetota bacterium]MDP6764173.1 CNNM domain-containing protein [Planctomycetota bacterium]MDP6989644.1 CNNM domain-containing protein [Planctomycetota bacterium]
MTVALVLACLVLSAVFSGSETGIYSLSRPRLDLLSAAGGRGARLVRWLVRHDAAILTTVLIGDNLVLEIATWRTEHLLETWGVGAGARELAVTALLAPFVFLFCEAFPKDLFLRRPLTSMLAAAPLLAAARVLFWPLERVLRLLTAGLERLFSLSPRDLTRRSGRVEVLSMLAEGARAGALDEGAERLAINALRLRVVPLSRCMVPWEEVTRLEESGTADQRRSVVRACEHTRLPLVDTSGGLVGYVHQLDVLGADGDVDPSAHARPMPCLDPNTPVDRALAELRIRGQRAAVVGTVEAPCGLVTLKDLLEEISGDLGTW